MNPPQPQSEEDSKRNDALNKSYPLPPRKKVKPPISNNPIPIGRQDSEPLDYGSNIEFTGFSREDLIDPKRKALKHHKNVSKNNEPTNNTQRQKPPALPTIIEVPSESDVPLYKVWPGNNRFLLNGRIMLGPKCDKVVNWIAWILILVVSIIYFAVAHPYLWDVDTILPLISLYLFLSTVAFFLCTSWTEPGIIPRKAVWKLNGEVPYPFNGGNKRVNMSTMSRIANKSMTLEGSRSLPVIKPDALKYCKICKIYRKDKTHHCNECGNCVAMFYHHSPFLNNCIGKRNYRHYLGFLMSIILLGICYVSSFILMLIDALGGRKPEVGPDDEAEESILENSAVRTAIILILGIPTAIQIIALIISSFYRLNLYIKDKKAKKEGEELPKNLDPNRIDSVNWCKASPSFVNFRQLISQEKLTKFLSDNPADKPA